MCWNSYTRKPNLHITAHLRDVDLLASPVTGCSSRVLTPTESKIRHVWSVVVTIVLLHDGRLGSSSLRDSQLDVVVAVEEGAIGKGGEVSPTPTPAQQLQATRGVVEQRVTPSSTSREVDSQHGRYKRSLGRAWLEGSKGGEPNWREG
jgi:hypothetical protein